MGKLLSFPDKLLLNTVLLGEAAIEYLYKKPMRDIYTSYYGWCPMWRYRKTHVSQSLYRMYKTGDIEKIVENGKVYYRLTNRGQFKITRKFPILDLAKKKWDGKWRMVIFDVPGRKNWKRDRLREKLKQLGFGMWQKSVYITPHPISDDFYETLQIMGMISYTVVVEVKQLKGLSLKEIAYSVWKIDKLEEKYWCWTMDVEKFLEKTKKTKEQKEQLINDYEMLLMEDPALPKEILPYDWVGEKANSVYKTLLNTNVIVIQKDQ